MILSFVRLSFRPSFVPVPAIEFNTRNRYSSPPICSIRPFPSSFSAVRDADIDAVKLEIKTIEANIQTMATIRFILQFPLGRTPTSCVAQNAVSYFDIHIKGCDLEPGRFCFEPELVKYVLDLGGESIRWNRFTFKQ